MTILLRQKPLPQVVRQIVQRDNGAWFDPEDLSTMFQDAAGTTPVTALEQPVGLWLDKSGNGNHATQSITASRPTLSARYNQLLNSATLSTQSVTTVAAQYTLSFTGAGSVTLSGTATGTLAGTGANNRVNLAFTPTAGTLTLTVTGTVTLAMLAFGTLTTYQAITTATSYDSVGWNSYIRFDGIDDYLNLPYMGLYANGSASVIYSWSRFKTGTIKYGLAEGNTASGKNYIPLRMSDTGVRSRIVNDTGTTVIFTNESSGAPTANPEITTFLDTGYNLSLYKNSLRTNTQGYSRSGTVTLNTLTIGALLQAYASENMLANLYGTLITKSALSDTDRRRCEQFLASRLSTLGVTLS